MSLMVLAICLLVSAFIAKPLLSAAFALSPSARWLYPVHMMMGMSGLRASLGERGWVGYSPSVSRTGDRNGDG